ncbi:3'(2'),5'-bisphosphate nucleotidase CysQ [Salinicola rhizosphaerae]|uniref:3'(2'),5'-bisphosphate nucleotidase CysQ n=1 Tax=Salinicola rhizosphaerae TaxID=1443141 RepID=A0ABQ3DPV3_9GAMM|nr:3'(2'),5'-bisphosphate nucleotidase CysQ [Salinicola rhizosphaerae]GHB09787.1 3'(2'),5'-bisphosphate nucleotidase CysQ [Salinicola rhizosphaerae]
MSFSLDSLCEPLTILARDAGDEIESISRQALETRQKSDDSPVTAADLAAHRCLVEGLPGIGKAEWPVLSEESASVPWAIRSGWETYWLVDPLDGTKEFLRGSDQYTVNIALIHRHRAVVGVIGKPRTGEIWYGQSGLGSWYQRGPQTPWQRLQVADRRPPRLVVSRFHRGEKTRQLIAAIPDVEVEELGSSLKCCRIAEGLADLYPRFGPTCEWDTAAAQAIVEGAGGALVRGDDWKPLEYNRGESLLNPPFVACASLDGAWRAGWDALDSA